MLTESENKILTEVGPKTPMGNLMREYWIPVLRSDQLERGGSPIRIKRLGEYFIAFRSPDGRAGLMDEACPHRGASMALARNEDCGLRCIYHGWKISPSGELLEAPTHPEDAPVHKMKTRSHPVREMHSMVWTWLGKGTPPPFPKLAFTSLPEGHVVAVTTVMNCGWLQPLETLWDVFHSQILHNETNRRSSRASVYFSKEARRRAGELVFDYPEMRFERTPYGLRYTNADAIKETHFSFVAPFVLYNTITPGEYDDKMLQFIVPVDDEHTLDWIIYYNHHAPLKTDGTGLQVVSDLPDLSEYMAARGPRSAENRWGQDREAMARGESFNGIPREGGMMIMAEDIIVIESQGRVDRTRETLAPVDRVLVEGRRVLLDAVAAHERGEPPIARDLDLSDVEALYVLKEPVTA